MKKGADRIADYFGSLRAVGLMALGCGIYLYYCLFTESNYIAKILPPMSLVYYVALVAVVFLYQISTWKKFKLFSGDWYKKTTSYLFFISESVIIFFVFSLLCWPFYGIYLFTQFTVRT